ncbi:hypothetical protein Sjap_014267 [Stephania japonica]|uniref:Protein LURP-one-related 7 n=1 Tax=Stephania japonica TaxID=461633 RepID=A0AAP0J0U0_9MAGN
MAEEPPPIAQIPVDLFVSRKRSGLTRGALTFRDSSDNVVFSVADRPSSKLLLDRTGLPLVSIARNPNGVWSGSRENGGEAKDLIFTAEKRLHRPRSRKEVDVVFVGGCEFQIRGSPFQRSCTVYQGDSVVAQTSLLYKLGKVLVGRRRFRLTIFPGFVDHTLVVALVLVFFGGRI